MENEAPLLAALRRRDPQAFAALFDAYSDKLYRIALGVLADEQAADCVVQDTFLRLFERLDQFEGRSQLGTWLYRIANNAALMRLRKKNPVTFSIDEPLETDNGDLLPRQFFDFCCLPERDLLGDEARQEMAAAIEALPETLRVVFVLRDIEGYSTKETAETLDISVPAVKTRLMRARLALRERLSAYFAHSTVTSETGETL